jgi:hypothetical protein
VSDGIALFELDERLASSRNAHPANRAYRRQDVPVRARRRRPVHVLGAASTTM